jgi:hypothetical protein
MAMLRLCKFYKDSGRLDVGQGIGFCDLDSDRTTCAGDIDSCLKSDSLKRYFFEQIKRDGGFEWEKRINALFSEDPKARA